MSAGPSWTTLVLIGPHGAGKTTLGRRLAQALGWRFDHEIGESLRRAALTQDAAAHAQCPQSAFDEQVLVTELARDAAVAALAPRVPRVVETWHPGNLAYAQRRSPAVAGRMAEALRSAARRERGLLVQPLAVSEQTLRTRKTEPGPESIVQFFLEVGAAGEQIAKEWGLAVAPTLHTDECTEEVAVAELLKRVR